MSVMAQRLVAAKKVKLAYQEVASSTATIKSNLKADPDWGCCAKSKMADPLLTEFKELSTTVGKRPFFGRYLMEEASQFAVTKED